MAESPAEQSSSLSSPQGQLSSPPSSSAETAAGEGTTVVMGEGQPERRKRGRPRKPKPEQPEEPKEKRPRGRPKGSKNKYPSKAAMLKNYSPQKTKRSRFRGGDDETDGAGGPSTSAAGSAATGEEAKAPAVQQ
ncbi:uncharacterized protein LOC143285054 [Babylonia areolata]|uniref:uncharacterized protein LOC143285054 n=1 Tax=Babylonia areolata TaxID=304850 RepID=UPI003FCFE35E